MPVNDKKSEFHESDTVRSMGNRLDVEKRRPSGKPGSFCSGIPDLCDQESLPPSGIHDIVYRESIFRRSEKEKVRRKVAEGWIPANYLRV